MDRSKLLTNCLTSWLSFLPGETSSNHLKCWWPSISGDGCSVNVGLRNVPTFPLTLPITMDEFNQRAEDEDPRDRHARDWCIAVDRLHDRLVDESKCPESSQCSKEDTISDREDIQCVLRSWSEVCTFPYCSFEDGDYDCRVWGHDDPEYTNDDGGKTILVVEVGRDALGCCFISWQKCVFKLELDAHLKFNEL